MNTFIEIYFAYFVIGFIVFVGLLGLVNFIASRFMTGKSGMSTTLKEKFFGSRMKISGGRDTGSGSGPGANQSEAGDRLPKEGFDPGTQPGPQ